MTAVPSPDDILPRLGPDVRETVIVDDRSFLIERPSESDRLPYTTQIIRAGEPGGRRLKGTLYRIQSAATIK